MRLIFALPPDPAVAAGDLHEVLGMELIGAVHVCHMRGRDVALFGVDEPVEPELLDQVCYAAVIDLYALDEAEANRIAEVIAQLGGRELWRIPRVFCWKG